VPRWPQQRQRGPTRIHQETVIRPTRTTARALLGPLAAAALRLAACSGNQMQTVPVVPGVDTSAYATVLHRR